jgi:acyl-CoA thioester hydrolase
MTEAATIETHEQAEGGTFETVPVHFDDLDSYGMVHHGRYASLLERGLTSYWVRAGFSFDRSTTIPDQYQVIRALEFVYEFPITSIGEVLVEFWIARLGRTSWTYAFRIVSKDRTIVHATGKRVQVNLDPATGKSTPFSPEAVERAQPLVRAGVAG